MESKECRKCKTLLPFSDFFKNHKLRDGRTYNCKQCMKAAVEKWRADNKGREAETKRKWWKSNYSQVKKRNKRWRDSNREKVRSARIQYSIRNKLAISLKKKLDRVNKPWLHRARVNNRKSRKQQATLRDLKGTELFKADIKEMYALAEELSWLFEGDKLEVDHIIPLHGCVVIGKELKHVVCGLNVPWNMQILTKHHNQVKNNRFDWTYDNTEWKDLLKVKEWIEKKGE